MQTTCISLLIIILLTIYLKKRKKKAVNKTKAITNDSENILDNQTNSELLSEPEPKLPSPENDQSPIINETNKLVKEASDIKSSDINKAIELIRKAIEISPEKSLRLKLANYIHMSGKTDEAYGIYEELLKELDKDDIVIFNSNKAEILEKICSLDYKSQQYEKYIITYSTWLQNIILAYACQGKSKELKKVLSDKSKLKFLSPAKLSGCFKKLNKENEKEEYNNKLNEAIEGMKDHLQSILDISIKSGKSSKTTQEKLKKLKGDEQFMIIYNNYNN